MPMFNKKKCAKCKYHGSFSTKAYHSTEDGVLRNMTCDYSKYANQTCLHSVGHTVVDRRGSDPNDCKLFERSASI